MRSQNERKIEFSVSGIEGLAFKGDRHDLEEMIGNLMDNANKWARHRVQVLGSKEQRQISLVVHDDGEGIAEEHFVEVLNRGHRLDETVAGSGLGLSIVGEIAELHGGSLLLARSPLGGLAAKLILPAA